MPSNESEHGAPRSPAPNAPEPNAPEPKRRTFLKASMLGVAWSTVAAGVAQPLASFEDLPSMGEILQSHYTKLTPEMLEKIMRRIEGEIARDYGADVSVNDYKPIEGVEFAYALNIGRCNGSRKCVTACMRENNVAPDRTEMAFIRVLEMHTSSMDLEEATTLYDHEEVPVEDRFYMPIQCHQCRKAPCTKACPTLATWQQDDGIIAIDYNWCIGCRYCMAACPYEARRFNWYKPEIAAEDINPDMGYLANRIRPRGVVEKCHFCLHRTRLGKNPACLEVCPTGARVFGNILDPDGPIQYILQNKRVYVLKEDARTYPHFYYFFDK